jgi:hypothetical protein
MGLFCLPKGVSDKENGNAKGLETLTIFAFCLIGFSMLDV